MSWTTGYRQRASLPTGPSLAQQAKAEMLAARTVTRCVTVLLTDPGYQRPALANRADKIRAEILRWERTEPRNRHERRRKAAILRDLYQEIQRPGSNTYQGG